MVRQKNHVITDIKRITQFFFVCFHIWAFLPPLPADVVTQTLNSDDVESMIIESTQELRSGGAVASYFKKNTVLHMKGSLFSPFFFR